MVLEVEPVRVRDTVVVMLWEGVVVTDEDREPEIELDWEAVMVALQETIVVGERLEEEEAVPERLCSAVSDAYRLCKDVREAVWD